MTSLKMEPPLQTFFEDLLISKHPMLLLDYDGTLSPFHADRSKAYPYPGVRERLHTLLSKNITEIVIISGRNVKELNPLLQLSPQPELWGCHGWEWISSDGTYHHYPLNKEMQEGLQKAREFADQTPYTDMIENKPFSIAIHWRGRDEETSLLAAKEFLNDWEQIAKEHSLEVLPFEGGFELRPVGRNKGEVVSNLLKKHPKRCPIAYLGDDLTDEQAFAKLGKKGLKVLVKDRLIDSLADIRIIPPEGLLEFLDLWIKAEGQHEL